MVLDLAKEAIDSVDTHSINFDDLKAGKASIAPAAIATSFFLKPFIVLSSLTP